MEKILQNIINFFQKQLYQKRRDWKTNVISSRYFLLLYRTQPAGYACTDARTKYGVYHIYTLEFSIHCAFEEENMPRELCAPQRAVIFIL